MVLYSTTKKQDYEKQRELNKKKEELEKIFEEYVQLEQLQQKVLITYFI